MNQPVNKDSILLFSPSSANMSSPTFELRGQRTVVAVGMEEGDYITFEVLKIDAADRQRLCGCILTAAQLASLQGVQELQCPACEDYSQRPRRLTPQNPTVVLDEPQNTLLRAVYHGTGIGAQSVWVWAVETNTKDLTDAIRGCPPVYFADEDQTWTDTGLIRCLSDQVTVELEQINDCGRRRWFESEDPQNWIDTGQIRCLANQTATEIEQSNQCGDRRWVAGPAQVWTATGVIRCLEGGDDTEIEQRNQCNQLRWIAGPAQVWTETGNIRCLDDQLSVEAEETNQCGERRWSLSGTVTQDWQPTGIRRCGEEDVEIQERNQCGQLRWTVCGAVSWIETGETRCTDNVLEVQETNQCGILRWTATEEVCGDSQHLFASLVASPLVAPHGSTFCWTVTLDSPVYGEPIYLQAVFSAEEQDLEHFPNPTAVIYPGQTTGQFCIDSALDHLVEHGLCLTMLPHARVEGIPTELPTCVTITADSEEEGSAHDILSIVPVDDPIIEGADAEWLVTLDGNVTDADLDIDFSLSGDEQTVHGYTNPTLTIPIGSNSGTVSVPTLDDAVDEPDRNLCITAIESARVTSVPAASCIVVQDNDAADPGDSIHTVIEVIVVPTSDVEGVEFCWQVNLNATVAGSDLLVVGQFSGTEQDDHGYANPSVVIPVGASTGQLCVTTVNDLVLDGTRELCLTVLTSPRITSVPAAVCADVVDDEELPPASLPASDFGGQCFVDNPSPTVSEYYVQFLADGTMRRKTLTGPGYVSYTWLPTGQNPADYEIRIDDTSDLALNRAGPARDAWHALGVLRDYRWQALAPSPTSGEASGTVRIRRIGEVTDDDTVGIVPTFVSIGVDCP